MEIYGLPLSYFDEIFFTKEELDGHNKIKQKNEACPP
jgi:hypothetical protein